MAYILPIEEAQRRYPEYEFIGALTPSAQKAAFHVKDKATGLDLCLKDINPESDLVYINREIQALTRLAHRNVARLYRNLDESGPDGRRHCIIEHFIPGEDLDARMPDGVKWPLPEVASFFSEVFDGLEHLATHSLVHRDLKPSNIRVHQDGYPVLIDFGMARHLSLSDLTRTGDPQRGNLAHFAPEQWLQDKHLISPKTDLFAAGIILYKAILGRHPFITASTRTADELREAVLAGTGHLEAADFKALPRPWTIILGKLLDRRPEARPASANTVAAKLRSIAGGI